MPVSRRDFLRIVNANERSAMGALLSARGLEAFEAQDNRAQSSTGRPPGRRRTRRRRSGWPRRRAGAGQAERPAPPPGIDEIRISSNENPLGPGKTVLDAILGEFPEAGRYPFNSTPNETKLVETIASVNKAKPENVVVGAGSQEILKTSIRAFTSPFRPLVTGAPTFENCTGLCRRLGHPVHEVKVDSQFRINLEEMLSVVRGAGMVFLNNPNNPTATVHSAKAVQNFVERVRRISPDTVILIDEAYHDYVTDPNYQTAIPLALSTPNVFVARTFSKAYGMAGMRIGYAIGEADTIKPMARLKMPYNISVFGIAATIAALNDPKHIEQERRGTRRCARSPSRRSRSWAARRRPRKATSSSSTSAGPRASSGTPARTSGSRWDATSRRSNTATCASRLGRWPRCSARPPYSVKSFGPRRRPAAADASPGRPHADAT